MKERKVLAAILIAVVIAGAVTAARRLSWDSLPYPLGALEYVMPQSLSECAAHLSAFTGLSYWLFSDIVGAIVDLGESGFWNFLRALRDIGRRGDMLDKNAPGTYTL